MSASVFKELNHQTKNVVNITSIMYNNKTFTRAADIANIFNKHFTSVAEKYLNDTANKSHSPNLILLKEFIKQKLRKENIFKIPLMTEQFVCKFISKLDKNKATGIDNISAKILHLSSPVIAKHITDICNHSIRTSTFPTSWKNARVIPLHKRNSTENPENYRPISSLPLLSKILEKHVYNALYEFLTVNDLISNKQSGFRSNHSCETALTILTDEWLNSMYSNEYCGAIFVDLCKAFDLVNHNILLQKLSLYNINNDSLLWFQSYLNDRKQSVKINCTYSAELTNNYDVPQGSILGPLLFLIYVNDLPLENRLGKIHLFADDATITAHNNELEIVKSQLTVETQNTYNWCRDNGMLVSADKTKAMLIISKSKESRLETID